MKTSTTIAVLLGSVLIACADDGFVLFFNSPTTKIQTNSVFGGPPIGLTSTNSGSYYYGLFVAPTNTLAPSQFTFTGDYGTNIAAAGRLNGNNTTNGALVSGYAPGSEANFLVRGWSANIGHDWFQVQAWLQDPDPILGWYGESAIAEDVYLGGGIYPTPVLFGNFAPSQMPGFTLEVIPEPSIFGVGATAAGLLLLRRISGKD